MIKYLKRLFCKHKKLYSRDNLGTLVSAHTYFRIYRCEICGALFIECFGELVNKDLYKRFY